MEYHKRFKVYGILIVLQYISQCLFGRVLHNAISQETPWSFYLVKRLIMLLTSVISRILNHTAFMNFINSLKIKFHFILLRKLLIDHCSLVQSIQSSNKLQDRARIKDKHKNWLNRSSRTKNKKLEKCHWLIFKNNRNHH